MGAVALPAIAEIGIVDELLGEAKLGLTRFGKEAKRGINRTGKQIGRVDDLFKPDFPDVATPVEEELAPDDTSEADAKLAQQRRSLDASRRGRKSLRIDLPTRSSSGLRTGMLSGIRIL